MANNLEDRNELKQSEFLKKMFAECDTNPKARGLLNDEAFRFQKKLDSKLDEIRNLELPTIGKD